MCQTDGNIDLRATLKIWNLFQVPINLESYICTTWANAQKLTKVFIS